MELTDEIITNMIKEAKEMGRIPRLFTTSSRCYNTLLTIYFNYTRNNPMGFKTIKGKEYITLYGICMYVLDEVKGLRLLYLTSDRKYCGVIDSNFKR